MRSLTAAPRNVDARYHGREASGRRAAFAVSMATARPCLHPRFLRRRGGDRAGGRGNMTAELLRALRGGPGTRCLSLKARGLRRLPRGLGKMKGLERLSLRDNSLRRLPQDMKALGRLKVLNLGNNNFEEVPEQLKYLKSLQTLHLFRNKITRISPLIFDGLQNLVLLNLNNNQLSYLPPEIQRLEHLECLSLDNNRLQKIPKEFCYLRKLCELHLFNNSITALPEEIKYLRKLKILILARNQIEELPDGLCKLKRLRVLDVAGNNIQIFPTAMEDLELEELYCESNPLLQKHPVSAIQEEDILTLKELTARFILDQLEKKNFNLHRALKQNLNAQKMLAHKQECAQCRRGFLGMWLECVQFVDIRQRMKTSRNLELLPVKALLCSYKCFNHSGHELFGIAVP
ncbi:leucine-rich repeat-containing protein 69 [Podarcis raffonei]|uniref:leucine-rich repeat-containing protein 69 n=1 Tax=Podarcis raffonei TaxID=65483 RepID=UPI00232951AA|nr:leucine-rich repeat-containing protein 69 [Podarcis raffonei]